MCSTTKVSTTVETTTQLKDSETNCMNAFISDSTQVIVWLLVHLVDLTSISDGFA